MLLEAIVQNDNENRATLADNIEKESSYDPRNQDEGYPFDPLDLIPGDGENESKKSESGIRGLSLHYQNSKSMGLYIQNRISETNSTLGSASTKSRTSKEAEEMKKLEEIEEELARILILEEPNNPADQDDSSRSEEDSSDSSKSDDLEPKPGIPIPPLSVHKEVLWEVASQVCIRHKLTRSGLNELIPQAFGSLMNLLKNSLTPEGFKRFKSWEEKKTSPEICFKASEFKKCKRKDEMKKKGFSTVIKIIQRRFLERLGERFRSKKKQFKMLMYEYYFPKACKRKGFNHATHKEYEKFLVIRYGSFEPWFISAAGGVPPEKSSGKKRIRISNPRSKASRKEPVAAKARRNQKVVEAKMQAIRIGKDTTFLKEVYGLLSKDREELLKQYEKTIESNIRTTLKRDLPPGEFYWADVRKTTGLSKPKIPTPICDFEQILKFCMESMDELARRYSIELK